jgi:hypothetical protein
MFDQFHPRKYLTCVFVIVLIWIAFGPSVNRVYAKDSVPAAVILDEINEPNSPDAFPNLTGMTCAWGAGSCNPCAYDVEQAFASLRTHGDLMDPACIDG